MHVRHLSLADFRSWTSAEVAFEPGASVLVGANGQGKTNLVEGLGYLASLASHRVATDAPLIRFGAPRAVVRAAVVSEDREQRVEVELVAGRANRAQRNGSPVPRPRDILGVLRTVLFAPEDLAIVRGDPGERRRFLDELVVARAPRLAGVRADYERVLRQRAALLKSAGGRSGRGGAGRGRSGSRGPDPAGPDGVAGVASTLDVWDAQLAQFGAQLLHARLAAVAELAGPAAAAYAQVAPRSEPLVMRYATALAESAPALAGALRGEPGCEPPDPHSLREALLEALAAARPAELERGVNLVGPHRDDLDLSLGPLPVRGYASHGEGWSCALALRLGSYDLLCADGLPGGDPVLILDDVFAELDADRRAQLALAAGKAEQAIVTAAVFGDVPAQLQGARFDVRDSTVTRAD